MVRHNTYRLVAACLLALLSAFGPVPGVPAGPDSTGPKVILFLWDGTQRNHLLELYNSGQLPNLQALVNDGGLLRTDLVINTETCQPGSGDGYHTQTGPGNSAIITGYGYPDQGNPNNDHPGPIPDGYTFYERLKASVPMVKTGIISGKHQTFWPTLPLSNAADVILYWYQGEGTQDTLTDQAITFLTRHGEASFFLYLHYGQPDGRGHAYGENSVEYSQAIVDDDVELGRVLSQLTSLGIRPQTRILVTTDHGFVEDGNVHDLCIADDLDLWIAADSAVLISKSGVDAYQTSLAPTLFDIFGLDKNVSPRFPSQSLYDDGKPLVPALQPIENSDGDGSYLVEWSQAQGADGYTLQESSTPDFPAPTTRYEGPDLGYQVSGQPNGTWYYRVRASNAAGDSPWSKVESAGVLFGEPFLLPINNPDGEDNYLVDWSEVSGAITYTLQEDADPAFTLPAVVYSGADSQHQVTGQGIGTWYYRVRASYAGGDSAWSNTESVVVNGTLHLNALMVSWKSAPRPGTYKVVAAVRVHDQFHARVPAVTVHGDWTQPDGTLLPREVLTNGLGQAKLLLTSTQYGLFQLCATDLFKAGYIYEPGGNETPDCQAIVVGP